MKCKIGLAELKTTNFWRAVFGEVLATLLYIILVCGSGASQPSNLHSSLTTGLMVALLANAFWDISGGHFNPSVTIGLTVVGKVPIIRCVFYVAAQCAGSAAGAALLYAYLPPSLRNELGALKHHPDLAPQFGFLIEMTITYQMMLTIMASTDPTRGCVGFQAPFAIGLSVAVNLLMAIPFTGASCNPARAFGPAVIMNIRKDQWVYWAGPVAGGILGSLSYKYFLRQKTKSNNTDEKNGRSETPPTLGSTESCI